MARVLFVSAYVGAVAVAVAPGCGDPYSGEDLTGGGPCRNDVVLSEENVDFGIVGCAAGAPPSRKITLKHRGKRQSLVKTTLSSDGQFSVLVPSPTVLAADQEIA